MKLSDYARKVGVSYRTAWRWWKTGTLKGYQLPTGTIIVEIETTQHLAHEPPSPAQMALSPPPEAIACIYARVSNWESRENLEKQAERLIHYATVKGYTIYRVVTEVGSGLNDNRKKLLGILTDDKYTILIVEHADRLTRFGLNYIKILLEKMGKSLEIVNLDLVNYSEDKADLLADLKTVVMSFCRRLYGLSIAKKQTEKLLAELQQNTTAHEPSTTNNQQY